MIIVEFYIIEIAMLFMNIASHKGHQQLPPAEVMI